jgi:DNA (cytosine-5)-methyltransferase 1
VFADPKDPRNTLPFRYAELLKKANEKYQLHFFVFENVSDLTGPKHIKRFNRIVKKMENAGFNVFHSVLNASDFTVPQRRKRVFIVGLNRKLYPSLQFTFPKKSGEMRTVADAISGLPKPLFFKRGLTPADIPHHPNHWTMMPKSSKLKKGMSSGRSFRRLKWNEVSPTVAYGNREIHVHPSGGRRLSVLEAMLLQGFPKTYSLTGSLSSQITQISNAVPPPMAKAIADQLYKILTIQQSAA